MMCGKKGPLVKVRESIKCRENLKITITKFIIAVVTKAGCCSAGSDTLLMCLLSTCFISSVC